jgi:aspartyl/asparaginyl beta-hydroxylase (cupin superfamily)
MRDFRYKLVGKIDVSNWKEKISSLTESDWNEYDYRQKKFEQHKDTRTIPIIFDEDFSIKELYTKTKWYDLFSENLRSIQKKYQNFYGYGDFIRVILVKQLPNTFIPPHVDSGMTLDYAIRTHIPIITNTDVIFTVGDEIKNMKDGEIWEINNREKIHSVENNSSYDRIHLIIDYLNHI